MPCPLSADLIEGGLLDSRAASPAGALLPPLRLMVELEDALPETAGRVLYAPSRDGLQTHSSLALDNSEVYPRLGKLNPVII